MNSGTTEFEQVKEVVDESTVRMEEEEEDAEAQRARCRGQPRCPSCRATTPSSTYCSDDAKFIKRDAKVGDELVFPLEAKDDYGRIAAQTAKQVIIQKIREAEKVSVVAEYGKKPGRNCLGHRAAHGARQYLCRPRPRHRHLALRRADPGERYRQGERIRALLYQVEESPRGIYLRLSRAHPDFLKSFLRWRHPRPRTARLSLKLSPARQAAAPRLPSPRPTRMSTRSARLVGQRGVRVSTVTSSSAAKR
jgi:N utilization substance protein A